MTKLRVLDLFSGIGGFSLGLERTGGFETVGFCETSKIPASVLARHWREVENYGCVIDFVGRTALPAFDVLAGGDPCPSRSKARSIHGTSHPDLSGYFLALVGRGRPEWVVRENVPAPDVADFCAALDVLGYRSCVLRMDAAVYTGQQRTREFVVACLASAWQSFALFVSQFEDGKRVATPNLGARPVTPALTCHRTRYDTRDCYIYEDGSGLRILDGIERERLAGYPDGWLEGLSEAAIAKCCGNSAVPQILEMIGRAILVAEREAA